MSKKPPVGVNVIVAGGITLALLSLFILILAMSWSDPTNWSDTGKFFLFALPFCFLLTMFFLFKMTKVGYLMSMAGGVILLGLNLISIIRILLFEQKPISALLVPGGVFLTYFYSTVQQLVLSLLIVLALFYLYKNRQLFK